MKNHFVDQIGWLFRQGWGSVFISALIIFNFWWQSHGQGPKGTDFIFLILSALLTLGSFVVWVYVLRRYRLYSGTPLSRIASAAQGYVMLRGEGRALESSPVFIPGSRTPCLWFRIEIGVRKDENVQMRSYEESSAPFALEEHGKTCLIYPEKAQITTIHKEVSEFGQEVISIWTLMPGDTIYAMGNFSSGRGTDRHLDAREELNDLLVQWKANRALLLEHFDLDHDGELNEGEWELVRQAAKREVLKRQQARSEIPISHALKSPEDGRAFYITNAELDDEIRECRQCSIIWCAVFLLSLLFLVRLWKQM